MFDDASATVIDEGFSAMRDRGMLGTYYYIGSSAGIGDLHDMYSQGWDIANHTHNHTDLTTLNQAGQETELTDCQDALEAEGYTRASKHVAYPGGVYDANTLLAMAATEMLTGRIGTGTQVALPLDDPPYLLAVNEVLGNTVSLQDAKDLVDDIVTNSKIGLVLLHTLVESPASSVQWGIDDFRDWLDYIISKSLPVITITQLYALNSGSIEVQMPHVSY